MQMANCCYEFHTDQWQGTLDKGTQTQAIEALESGKIIYLPKLSFLLQESEQVFLQNEFQAVMSEKSVKFSGAADKVWGIPKEAENIGALKNMMRRYSENARALVVNLLPQYAGALTNGNTSFRPVEAKGRVQSKRQDDRRLHVDAFPSRPNGGTRILRVFTNVNPNGRPREWEVGEEFAKIAAQFLPRISAPLPGSAKVLKFLKITKSKRTPYDHYMLNLHDKMKLDDQYQRNVPRETLEFPPGSSWVVYSDQVSHAALGGQFLMEQTFSLPVSVMAEPGKSPLRLLEGLVGRRLA